MRFYKLSFLALAALAAAAPQRGKAQTAQQQAAQIPQGISQANDGSTILDTTAMIKCVLFLLPKPAWSWVTTIRN